MRALFPKPISKFGGLVRNLAKVVQAENTKSHFDSKEEKNGPSISKTETLQVPILKYFINIKDVGSCVHLIFILIFLITFLSTLWSLAFLTEPMLLILFLCVGWVI